MKLCRVWPLIVAALILTTLIATAAAGENPASSQDWRVPTAMRKLKNGLTVIVSEDHSAPTFGLCITYGIGFRLEPEGRTGFAHLFEHMMFEGTPEAPKGVFDRVVEGGGGWNNGDTRFDFTEYIETALVSALDPVLWLEADRMKALDFSPQNLDNQRQVVEEEVRVNVLNQPYGSFYWLDLPQKAFNRFPNAHNSYGDFKDLDSATIQDVKDFFRLYYAPNNAVLAISGDLKPDEVFERVERFFGPIPRRPVPAVPDVSEPPQSTERRFTEQDKLSRVPALAIGYRMPSRTSHDAVVAAVVGELLHNGEASRLYQVMVKQKKVALRVSGGVNWPLGNAFEYNGPTLMTSMVVYPANVKESAVVSAYDAVMDSLAERASRRSELERIRAKMRWDGYSELEVPVSRASALAHATLFDRNPLRVNEIPNELTRVTSDDIKSFARKYLVAANRTIINRMPGSGVRNAKEGSGGHAGAGRRGDR